MRILFKEMFQINNKIARNILVSCDHGIMCVNRFDYNTNNVGASSSLLDHGNNCTVEADACIKAISHIKNPIIFDVGANIGTFTSWMARYFTEGKIYCFEPQRLVYQILCANLAINNLHNVYAYNAAIGNLDAKIKILEPNYDIPNDFGTFSLVRNTIENKTSELIIDIFTLDNFVQTNEIPRIDLLKIDAEGMDYSVLAGAKKVIELFKPIIFIEYFDNYENNKDNIENYLTKNNYTCNYLGNNIIALPKKEENGK